LKIAGSVALVTGAADGLGWGIAERLAAEGASVVIADVDEKLGPERATSLPDAVFVRCDVTDDAQLGDAIDLAGSRYGRLDTLVNNAGGAPDPQFPEAGLKHWSYVLDLNLRSVMRAIQLALPLLSAQGGCVVNIASIAALGFEPYGAPAYAAAKSGVVRLTASLATISGVRVNAICPDWIDTPSSRRNRAQMSAEELAALPPILTPAEVAEVVVSLIVDDSAAGRVLQLRGGEEPRMLTDRRSSRR
jgi:NAD(P)-dependent dehydrogenase (short-subunit alcohol dehydrogenase family)